MRAFACVVFCVAFCLAACGGGSKPATTTPTNTGTGTATGDRPCLRAADHLIELMSAEAKGAPPEKVQKFKESFVGHCEADKWSTAMQSCVLDAKAPPDLEKCDSLMTPEQKEALAKDDRDEAPAQAAPVAPGAAPPGGSRGASPKGKKTGDPCEGGE